MQLKFIFQYFVFWVNRFYATIIILDAKFIKLKPIKSEKDLEQLPATYLICYLNEFSDAKKKLLEAKPYLKQKDGNVYQSFKESVRILRKVKYS